MFIPIILGTAREGRQSEKVAKFVLEEVKNSGIETEMIDVRDYRIKATDNTGEIPEAKKLGEKIKKADALIIVSPEYNHSFPGELKIMLDMLLEEYSRKPVGLCGVSRGVFGGARGMEMLNLYCVALGMIPMVSMLYFPMVQDLFDQNGQIKDRPSYSNRVKKFLDDLKQAI